MVLHHSIIFSSHWFIVEGAINTCPFNISRNLVIKTQYVTLG